MSRRFTTDSPAATERAGRALGSLVAPGDVVALAGDLGAGKTHLVQGIAHGLGVTGPVGSPTFNLLLVHRGRLPLYHFDLYRLEREEDLDDLAFYETLEGDGVSVIEWGDRFPQALPADRLLVTIRRTGDETREFSLDAGGPGSERLASGWLAECGAADAGSDRP